jgi:hypothetical protein
MTRNKQFALLWIAALAFCATAINTRAQMSDTPPIVVKSSQPDPSKPIKTRFEVMHMFETSIQVRSLDNGYEVHTFVYSEQIRDNMQKLFEQGGYQYGDKVTVWHLPGKDVALKIKGKPSKPL